jgi:hypothetical protein
VRIVVGVDTGKTRHQAAAYEVDSANWVGQLGFTVGRDGFEQFTSFLQGVAADAADVLIGLEATGH